MIGFAIETFVATTLLMLLVLALRSPVRKAFGPHMAYSLWLLPVARLILPPLPGSWRDQAAAPVAAASDIVAVYFVEPLGAVGAARPQRLPMVRQWRSRARTRSPEAMSRRTSS